MRLPIFPISFLATACLLAPLAAAPASKKKSARSTKTIVKKATPPAVPRPPSVAREPYLGAVIVHANSGRILFEDNANAQGHPASTLKLMLLLVTLEQIRDGKLTYQDPVPVSPAAVGMAGASLKLRAGESFTVEEMLYALMIHSGNDVAVALAEKIAGSEEAYRTLINQRAQALGMAGSSFHSANGLLPQKAGDPADIITTHDLGRLSLEVLRHPDALRFTSARSYTFRPHGGPRRKTLETHNYILDTVKGCDGLKTGFIRAAGYCISATAQRGEDRIVAVLLGATSEKSRNKLAAQLLEKGFTLLAQPPTAP